MFFTSETPPRPSGILHQVFVLGAIMVVMCTQCSKAPSVENSGSAKPQTAAAPSPPQLAAFDTLRKQLDSQSSIGSPNKFYEDLLSAAQQEKIASGESAAVDLVERFPNENVGIFVFETHRDDLLDKNPEDAVAFVAALKAELPDTAIARSALDWELARLATTDPNEFLFKCDAIIAADPASKDASIALLRKADHYAATGNFRNACLADLDFCLRFPDSLKTSGLNLRFAGHLRKAGLLLESQLIEKSSRPDNIARLLSAQLTNALGRTDESQFPSSFIDAYVRHAPDPAAIEADLTTDPSALLGPGTTKLWNAARMALLGANDLDSEMMAKYDQVFIEAASSVTSAGPTSGDDLEALYECANLLADNYFAMNDKWLFSRRDRPQRNTRPGFVTYDALTEGMVSVPFTLWEATQIARNLEIAPQRLAEIVDKQVAYFEPNKRFNRVIALYRWMSARFPEDPIAPTYMMKLVNLYLNATPALGKREEALKVYQELNTRYPDSPEAPQARIGEVVLLYESQKFAEAYTAAQLLLANAPESDDQTVVSAKIVSALSTAGLGDTEGAYQAMVEITEKYFRSPLAAQAYFWLATNALGNQDYEGARNQFQEIIDRYPDTATAYRARPYLDRIQKTSK